MAPRNRVRIDACVVMIAFFIVPIGAAPPALTATFQQPGPLTVGEAATLRITWSGWPGARAWAITDAGSPLLSCTPASARLAAPATSHATISSCTAIAAGAAHVGVTLYRSDGKHGLATAAAQIQVVDSEPTFNVSFDRAGPINVGESVGLVLAWSGWQGRPIMPNVWTALNTNGLSCAPKGAKLPAPVAAFTAVVTNCTATAVGDATAEVRLYGQNSAKTIYLDVAWDTIQVLGGEPMVNVSFDRAGSINVGESVGLVLAWSGWQGRPVMPRAWTALNTNGLSCAPKGGTLPAPVAAFTAVVTNCTATAVGDATAEVRLYGQNSAKTVYFDLSSAAWDTIQVLGGEPMVNVSFDRAGPINVGESVGLVLAWSGWQGRPVMPSAWTALNTNGLSCAPKGGTLPAPVAAFTAVVTNCTATAVGDATAEVRLYGQNSAKTVYFDLSSAAWDTIQVLGGEPMVNVSFDRAGPINVGESVGLVLAWSGWQGRPVMPRAWTALNTNGLSCAPKGGTLPAPVAAFTAVVTNCTATAVGGATAEVRLYGQNSAKTVYFDLSSAAWDTIQVLGGEPMVNVSFDRAGSINVGESVGLVLAWSGWQGQPVMPSAWNATCAGEPYLRCAPTDGLLLQTEAWVSVMTCRAVSSGTASVEVRLFGPQGASQVIAIARTSVQIRGGVLPPPVLQPLAH